MWMVALASIYNYTYKHTHTHMGEYRQSSVVTNATCTISTE